MQMNPVYRTTFSLRQDRQFLYTNEVASDRGGSRISFLADKQIKVITLLKPGGGAQSLTNKEKNNTIQ